LRVQIYYISVFFKAFHRFFFNFKSLLSDKNTN